MKIIFKNIKDSFLIASIAVIIAFLVGLFSDLLIETTGSILIMIIVLLTVIGLAIVADILGTAAAAASLKPVNALASKKELGAKEAVIIIKKADRFANICQDVVGDVLNTLSGVFGVGIALVASADKTVQDRLILVMTILIVALTVFGKALGKSYAIRKANSIMILCGKSIYFYRKIIGR